MGIGIRGIGIGLKSIPLVILALTTRQDYGKLCTLSYPKWSPYVVVAGSYEGIGI